MTLNVNITDPTTNLKARVDDGTEDNALVVATRPLKTFTNSTSFFTNSDFGSNMNQNALAMGTPIKVHNGIDDILWTASSIQGNKFNFNSTDQNHTTESGSATSIKIDNPAINDILQIAKGSTQDLMGYSALSLWVYIDKDWTVGDSIQISAWDTVAGGIVGVAVNIEDFIDFQTFDIWHHFIVSLTDMELTDKTIDAIRIEILTKEGKTPKFYLDDIQFEETGEPITFQIKPAKGTWLHVSSFTFSMAVVYSGTLADSSFQKLPYDSFMGISLPSGIVYQRVQAGIVQFSVNIKNVLDLFQIPQTFVGGSGSDGTNTWMSLIVNHIEPFILKAEDDDVLTFSISDDLTDFLHFRIAAGASIEQRSQVTL